MDYIIKRIELHSKGIIEDNSLLESVNSKLEEELVDLYFNAINNMKTNSLSNYEKKLIMEGYEEGLVDEDSLFKLMEDNILDNESLDLFYEGFMGNTMNKINSIKQSTINKASNITNNLKNKFTPQKQNIQQQQPLQQKQNNKPGFFSSQNMAKIGQGIKTIGNKALAGGAKIAGHVANAVGAHNLAKNIYSFAANRYKTLGNKDAQKQMITRAQNAKTQMQNRNVQKQANLNFMNSHPLMNKK